MSTNIATVAIGIIELIDVGQDIYRATVDAMDAIEAKGVVRGEDKKKWVLAFIKEFVWGLGYNWKDWVQLISDFIDKVKFVYNEVKYLF